MKFVIGNWKMNGTRAILREMIERAANIQTENRVALCVPFTMLGEKSDIIAMGAQDISTHDRGAYTGEISGAMLAEAGAKYVIVGHSERRMYHDETNDIVRAKAARALESGLTPIICVGETADERRAGKTLEIITKSSVLCGGDGEIRLPVSQGSPCGKTRACAVRNIEVSDSVRTVG